MFDFDFDIDWKSVAIGAGAVATVVGAAYGISKLCEDDDDEGSSRGGESSLPKQKSPDEILTNVTAMNKVANSCMPFETIQAVADKFNFIGSMIDFVSVHTVFKTLIPVAVILGVGIGFLGSRLTIRKHLKV